MDSIINPSIKTEQLDEDIVMEDDQNVNESASPEAQDDGTDTAMSVIMSEKSDASSSYHLDLLEAPHSPTASIAMSDKSDASSSYHLDLLDAPYSRTASIAMSDKSDASSSYHLDLLEAPYSPAASVVMSDNSDASSSYHLDLLDAPYSPAASVAMSDNSDASSSYHLDLLEAPHGPPESVVTSEGSEPSSSRRLNRSSVLVDAMPMWFCRYGGIPMGSPCPVSDYQRVNYNCTSKILSWTVVVPKIPERSEAIEELRLQTVNIAARENIDVNTITEPLEPKEPQVSIAEARNYNLYYSDHVASPREVADFVALLVQHCDRELFLRRYLQLGQSLTPVVRERKWLAELQEFMDEINELYRLMSRDRAERRRDQRVEQRAPAESWSTVE